HAGEALADAEGRQARHRGRGRPDHPGRFRRARRRSRPRGAPRVGRANGTTRWGRTRPSPGGARTLYNGRVAEPRRYQLQSEAANRLIEQLVETLAIPPETRGYFSQMLTTVLKLHEDGASTGDLKITNTALKELRYSFKVFAPYAEVPKVTVFGSARTPAGEPASVGAVAFFPGGFGSCDEVFEALTLMQTGKSPIVPVVLLEVGAAPYWRTWEAFAHGTLVAQRLIDAEDTALFRVVESVDAAIAEIMRFYRVFHSARIVGDNFVFRLRRPLADAAVRELQRRFDDILKGPADQAPGPLPHEGGTHPELPRLVLPFDRSSYGRLRRLIDFVNAQ